MNSKTASKARIYLYNEENIIKKITYIYDDGSESKPLTVFKHIGMFKDSLLFGEEMNICFQILSPHRLQNYCSDVDEFEIINESEHTVTISAFGKTAELIGNYVEKGQQLAVEGRIKTGSYTAQDASKRYTFDVVVENITFINSRKSASERKESEPTTTNEQTDIFSDFGENVAIEDDFLD